MGYKKQSKRKSPIKQTGYGRSQKNAVSFNNLQTARTNRNLTGQAVGAIGTSIGDAIQEFDTNYENEQAASTQEAQAGLDKTNKAAADAFGGGAQVGGPETPAASTLPELGKLPERKTDPNAGKQIKSYEQTGDDAFQKAINAGKSPEEAAAIKTKTIADSKAYNQKQYGTDAPTYQGKTNNYINSSTNLAGQYVPGSVIPTDGSSAYASPEGSQRREGIGPYAGPYPGSPDAPIQRSPFRRLAPIMRSPFYATKGRKLGELAQSSLTNLSYLGQAGQAGAEGYNSQVDRHNYAQAVREEQAAELDEEFGELSVEPTGFKPYDASVEGLAREWKTEFVDAKKAWKAGKLSNEEWTDTKHRLQGNAASYGKAAGNLQQSMKNWLDNKGEISNSTKPEVVDFFNTMEKAPDSLTVKNIDGVPTFVGQTLGGQPISMPVDQIANGSAAMRFNTKVDLGKELAPTIKELQGLKTEIETSRGIGTGNQAWDTPAVQNKVNYSLDKIVNNNAKLRSIAAEVFGYDYDQFEERVEAGDDMKALVKAELLSDIQESYFPVQKTTKTNQQLRNEQLTGQYKQKQIEAYGQAGTGGANNIKKQQAITSSITNAMQTPEGRASLTARAAAKGITIHEDPATGEMTAFKGDNIVQGADAVTQFLIESYGGKIGNSGLDSPNPRLKDETPVNRSPFKRMMDYVNGIINNK